MSHAGLLLALLSLGAPPDSPSARAASPTGASFAVTLSASDPRGSANADTRLIKEQFSTAYSLGAEACWRPHGALEVGLAADVGYVPLAPTACPPEGTCRGTLARAGALVRLRAAPHHRRFDTWIAAGAGAIGVETRVLGMSQRLYGFEYLRVTVGVDFLGTERLFLGLFGAWSLDEFVRETVRASGYATETASIENPARHGWFTLGLRGSFGPARAGGRP